MLSEEISQHFMIHDGSGQSLDVVNLLNDPIWRASEEDYLPTIYIPKRNGGRRKITEPKPYLKEAQGRVVAILRSFRYGPSIHAHGFVNKRGRRTNATPHVGHSRMLKMDIEDFFGSCSKEMVAEALGRLNPPEWLVHVIERLCFLEDGLPQGAPSSPMLSNIVARHMDYRLSGLCMKYRAKFRGEGQEIVYTRYADDLTFSSNWPQLRELVHPVSHILSECGFSVKQRKTKYFAPPARLESCGVVVSGEKINARRRDRLYWRGRLHKMIMDMKHGRVPPGRFRRRNGRVSHIKPKMLRRIGGKIAAIVDISPQDKERLFSKFAELKELCR